MLLWSGQVVSTLGSSATSIVYPLLILSLTDSPAAAGFAGALRAAPYLIFSLPVGALIDRWDRKRTMILCDAGRALADQAAPNHPDISYKRGRICLLIHRVDEARASLEKATRITPTRA